MPRSTIIEFFWPPVVDGDYLETARKRCLLVISISAGMIGLLSGLRDVVDSYHQFPTQTLVAVLAPLIFFACPVMLSRSVSTKTVALFFLGVTYAALLSVPLIAGGMYSHSTFYMVPWAILATLFLGWRYGVAAAALIISTYACLHFFRDSIAPSMYEVSTETISEWLFLGLSFMLIILCIGSAIIQHEMEQATHNLAEARANALSASDAKSAFLANVSHEIRTPMNGVLGMAEMLQSASLTEKEKTYLQAITSSSEALLTLINDILDFSRIEAGSADLDEQPFSLRQLVDQIATLFSVSAHHRQLEFDVHYDAQLPEYVVGDDGRVRQILVNLVGNALKFTNTGHVSIAVSANVEGANATLAFAIEDTGIGIPADKLETVFNNFEQVDTSAARRYEGVGLGLAISKRLAQAMGGDITARSVLGEGSTFTFSVCLPVAHPKAQPIPEFSPVNDATHDKLRILIAEDNEVNRMVVDAMLDSEGHDVEFAVNGAKAVSAYKRRPFDLIFMDLSMPEMGGNDATRAIRTHEHETNGAKAAIVCLTAHAFDEHRDDAVDAGMDDYLSKPVRRDAILAMIEKWAGARDQARKSA